MPIPMGYANGLGRLQTQHSCILLMDVTEHCNLNCPTCFAASGTNVGRYARLPHILRTLDASIEREGGKIDVLMLSGGEPTVHPEIVEIIKAAVERKVTRVLLNTNGIRVARDDRFLAALHRAARPGRGLPPVRRLRARDAPLSPRRGPARDEGARHPAPDRCAHLHHAHHGRGAGRERPRDRPGRRLRLRHQLHRRRGVPAGLRLRARQPDRSDEPDDDHRRPQAPRAADRWTGDRRGLHRAAVQPSRLLRDHVLRARGRQGRIGPSRSWWGSSG